MTGSARERRGRCPSHRIPSHRIAAASPLRRLALVTRAPYPHSTIAPSRVDRIHVEHAP